MTKRISLGVCTLILLMGAALIFRPRPLVVPGKGVHLVQLIPAEVGGWQSKELRVGETEADMGAVEKTLRFDDVFYREYRSTRGTVTVYAAYWGPGKMPTQLVASHTPDRCWSSAGWVCQEIAHRAPLVAGPVELRPGEWRLFRAPTGGLMYVQYWHVVGRDLYDYGERFNRVPSAWRWWRDVALQSLRAPPEQYFVRVASDRPFKELAGDIGWAELLSGISRLGLTATPTDLAR